MDPPPFKDDLVVFQVALSEERTHKRFRDMKHYSTAAMKGELFNCANMVSYLLGLNRSNKYLSTCVWKSNATRFQEMIDEIKSALEACGKPSERVVKFSPSRPISELSSLESALLPGYATNVIIYKQGNPVAHSVAIGKQTDGTLLFADPQIGTPEQYPKLLLGREEIEASLTSEGWTHWSGFLSPPKSIIHEVDQEACHATTVPEIPLVAVGMRPKDPTVTVTENVAPGRISELVKAILAAQSKKPGGRKTRRRRKQRRLSRKKVTV